MQPVPTSHRRIYVQGLVVNVLNPKTALFFLAFLPQFVDPKSGSVTLQVSFLGVIFATIAFTSDCCYALAPTCSPDGCGAPDAVRASAATSPAVCSSRSA